MQQTLLSLVALLIATLLSFSQMRVSMQSQQQLVQEEMEQMALGVAQQTMGVIQARPFDAALLSNQGDSYASESEFTAETDFGISGDCKLYEGGSGTNCATIEDFHGTNGKVPFRLASDSVMFDVEVDVRYVCDNLDPASASGSCTAPTDGKEVIISVQDIQPSGKPARLPERITYSEVVAYP